jgi:hypothetical protein
MLRRTKNIVNDLKVLMFNIAAMISCNYCSITVRSLFNFGFGVAFAPGVAGGFVPGLVVPVCGVGLVDANGPAVGAGVGSTVLPDDDVFEFEFASGVGDGSGVGLSLGLGLGIAATLGAGEGVGATALLPM